MRLAPVALSLLAGCSTAPAKEAPTVTVVDLSAALDASAPDADTANTDPPEPPAEVPGLAKLTVREIKLANKIHFETDQPDIRSESLPLLDAVATLLLSHPKVTIEIQC